MSTESKSCSDCGTFELGSWFTLSDGTILCVKCYNARMEAERASAKAKAEKD